ncbi:MAG: YkgJ family cysteine cluster protein [Promethearchaeota archaeon]
MNEREQNYKEINYECVQCGNCCRAGFEIVIEKEDIERWIKAKKNEFLQYIQIDPKCISPTGLGGYHIEEVNTLKKIEKKYKDNDVNEKLDELKDFILNNHTFLGNGPPLPIYSFLPDLGRTPILIPKSFLTILNGLKWGLIYSLKFELGGYCPFLKENLCSIHPMKPNVCRSFPYNKNGELKIDDYFIKICKGITKNSS